MLLKISLVLFKKISMEGHVDHLLSSCGSSLYALSLLRAHDMQAEELQEMFRSNLVLSRLMYRRLKPGEVLPRVTEIQA